MYKISEFCAMVGLPKSKIRFYEKYGLFQEKRTENGYRYFTREDAFRVNAFLVLLQYGFTVEKSIQMLDEAQPGEQFARSLEEQKARLMAEIQQLDYRVRRLEGAIGGIRNYGENRFKIEWVEDYLYVHASEGLDFSPAVRNAKILVRFYDQLSVSRCARVISREELFGESPEVNPSYVIALPASCGNLLGEYNRRQVKRMELGKCLIHTRTKNRAESVKRESFQPILDHVRAHGLTVRGNVFLVPTFLNLDEKHSDVETLFIPVD